MIRKFRHFARRVRSVGHQGIRRFDNGETLSMDDKPHPIQKKILNDLCRYVPQIVVPALIAFVSVPVYTRLFDPSAYGNFNIVRATMSLLDRASSWIGCSLTRYYNDYEKNDNLSDIVTTVLKINFIVSIVIIVPLLFIVNSNMTSEFKLLLGIGLGLFALQLTSSTLTNVLRMQRQINLISIFVITQSSISFLVSIILIVRFKFRIESILLGNLIVNLVQLPFLWRAAVSDLFKARHAIDIGAIRKFFKYGIPLTISALGIWILDVSDRYIIKLLLSSYEVGVYSACYNVIWNSLFLLVNLFFMMEEPLAMKIYVNDGKEALEAFIRCETRLFLIIMVPLVTIICSYSDTVLNIMVAKEYHIGKGIVPYVAMSVMIIGVIYKYQLGLLAMEKTKCLMYIVFIAGTLNVALNVFLIPIIGIVGAGVSTLFSYIVYLALVIVTAKKHMTLYIPIKSIANITASSFLSVYLAAHIVTDSSSLVQLSAIGISIVLFVLLLVIFGEIKSDEVNGAKILAKTWSSKILGLFSN